MKSYVTMEQKVCIVCGTVFDSGAILLDRRLQQRFEPHTVTGYGMCAEHEKLCADGFVALVECDPEKSRILSDTQTIQPETAYRTGNVAHLKTTAFEAVFKTEVPKGMVCFVEPGVIEKLRNMQEKTP